jgi:hypothetical protein
MMNVVDYVDSFVEGDVVMRYFGGGIGHLKNAPPLEVPGLDSIDPSSKEMAVEEDDDDPCIGTNDDLGTAAAVQQSPRDVVMNGGELVQLEVSEDDEVDEDDEEDGEDSDAGDEGGDQTDEDEDEDERERTTMVMPACDPTRLL